MIRPATALLVTGLVTVSAGVGGAPVRAAAAAAQAPPVESPRPAQTPPATAPPAAPQTAKPAPPRPRPATSSAATLTMTVKLTDSAGAQWVGAKVRARGRAIRAGVPDAPGRGRFRAMRPGNSRVRFEPPPTITRERVVVRGAGGEPTGAAPTPAPPPPPPP